MPRQHMTGEHEPTLPELSAIRFQREENSLTVVFEADDKPVAKLTLPAIAGSISFRSLLAPVESEEPRTPAAAEANVMVESRRTVTLSGRLKSKPQPGRPDRSKNPTAWARFAAHQDGERDAHFYVVTFHRHTAKIALTLPKEAPITVEGYAHPSNDPEGKRLDTLSVFNIVAYPGKPQ